MESIILIGGGGHCKSCIDVIECGNQFSIAGIVDTEAKVGSKVLEYNIIGSDTDLPELARSFNNFFITIGQIGGPGIRMKLFSTLKALKVKIPIISSPNAYISKSATIGEGTIIMHGSIINSSSIIGKNCIINSRSLIEHDVIIGNHVHIATGALINGGVKIGDSSFIGSGSVCKQGSEIPKESFIKAHTLFK